MRDPEQMGAQPAIIISDSQAVVDICICVGRWNHLVMKFQSSLPKKT